MPPGRPLRHRALDWRITHRVVPWPMARVAVRAWAERLWESDAAVRRDATKQMTYLLGRSSRAADIETLAQRYVVETLWRNELRWRPRRSTAVELDGTAAVHDLMRTRRGIIINFVHQADYYGPIGSLDLHGIHTYIPAAPWFVRPDALPFQRQIIGTITFRGGEAFSAEGSYVRLRWLLSEGKTVALSSDVAGGAEMMMLGRRVLGAGGAAHLACETGAWIVPMTIHRQGHGQRAVLETPVDPHVFSHASELQAEIAMRHEPGILAWPEALEEPLRRWKPADPEDYQEYGYDEVRMATLRI